MSTNSGVIDTTQSMIIIKPDDYPQNFGHTTREDYPVTVYPIQAFDASNVLPTAMGYKSYFDESTSYLLSALPAETQKILVYQSANLDNLMLAFGEYGIKVARPTTPTADDWETLVDTSSSAVTNVRRLWTYCVIANRLYMYQQGHSKFYALVDQATYDAASGASLIAGATRTRLWNKWGTGLISYIPSFINMAGQIGLFRADNRLGFWDSDNAVAWSSAVAIEDFKPDVKTFAGVTTFADVQGRIVMVLGSGDDFIIYATKSIVMARGLNSSPEKWSGTAIMSEIGVAFDSQVCAGQPDQLQFCITQAGLLQINQGAPEYIASEVMDYLSKESPSLALSMIDGRYLFISTLNEFKGSSYQITGTLLTDYAGDGYLFPKPTYPTDWPDQIGGAAGGDNGNIYAGFGDFEPIVDPTTIPKGTQLIPCYDVKGFDSTWANTTYSSITYGLGSIPSKLNASSWVISGFKVEPVVTVNSYYTDKVFDKAGEEFVTAIQDVYDRYLQHKAYQDAFVAAVSAWDFPVNLSKPVAAGLEAGMVAYFDNEVIEDELYFDLIDGPVQALANKCRFWTYWNQYTNMRVRYKFTGVEQVVAGSLQYLFLDGDYGIVNSEVTGTAPLYDINGTKVGTLTGSASWGIHTPKAWCSWSLTAERVAEISEYAASKSSVWPWAAISDVTATDETTMNAVGRYMLRFHPGEISNGSHSAASISKALWSRYSGDFVSPGYTFYDGVADSGLEAYQTGHAIHIGCTFLYVGPLPRKSISVVILPPADDDRGFKYLPFPGSLFSCSPEDSTRQSPFSATRSYANTIIEPGGSWFYGQKEAIYKIHGYPNQAVGAPTHTLVGSVTAEIIMEPGTATEVTLYDADLSGWGYIPNGGFSFRKTHSRHFSTSCPMPISPITITPEQSKTDAGSTPDWGITVPPYTPNPPYNWQYPDAIPLPPTAALFQKGSLSPYYPTYKGAAVYDMLLTKFGVYNNDHKALVNLMPVNRVDSTIMPVIDAGMFGGALRPDCKVSLFKEGNPASYIVYGKIGYYRRGMSLATEAVAHFSVPATGQLIVECSMDGRTINRDLSYAVPLNGDRLAILPFTLRAKWFTIRVEGNFELTYLELRAERKGRR